MHIYGVGEISRWMVNDGYSLVIVYFDFIKEGRYRYVVKSVE